MMFFNVLPDACGDNIIMGIFEAMHYMSNIKNGRKD